MTTNPNAPSPNKYFYAYIVTRNSTGSYTVKGSAVRPKTATSGKTKFDVYDTGTDSSTDSKAQLGDVSNDHYEVKSYPPGGSNNTPLNAVFKGSTSGNQSFVGKVQASVYYAGGTGYYLYTNKAYASGATITTSSSTPYVICYAAGTLIRTTRGDVTVESLAVGDLVVTASGAHRPIRWLGHRTLDCRNTPHAAATLPVRIAAHAIGENKPARDLWVSPGHAICLDVVGETLVVASALVNGSTIRQMDVDSVTYWHVELDSHDIILAENLAAESFIDMGNRGFFVENGVVDLAALPDGRPVVDTYDVEPRRAYSAQSPDRSPFAVPTVAA